MPQAERSVGRLDVLVALLIGLVSLGTIFLSFQASLYASAAGGHDSAREELLTEAASEHQVGYLVYTTDVSVWLEIRQLQTPSTFPGDVEARATVEALVAHEFSQAFHENFGEWVRESDADGRRETPLFDDVWYTTNLFAAERADVAEADIQREAALADSDRSTRLISSTVVFSVALFLLGIVGASRSPRLRVGLVIAASIVVVVGTVVSAGVAFRLPDVL
jgi:hypothetical protein